MPSCEPSELIDNARCLDQCIPKGLQMAVLILLFGELIDMPGDAETILSDANCLDQCIPDGMKMSVLVSLACQLVDQGGTLQTSNDAPAGFVAGVTEPVAWFAVTSSGSRYLIPGYAP